MHLRHHKPLFLLNYLNNILRCTISLVFIICALLIRLAERAQVALVNVLLNQTKAVVTYQYLTLPYFHLRIRVLLDLKSIMFFLRVRAIRAAVLAFSRTYISNEKFSGRFHLLVLVFVVSIIILIFSPDFLTLLIG